MSCALPRRIVEEICHYLGGRNNRVLDHEIQMKQPEEFRINGAYDELGLDSICPQAVGMFGDRASNTFDKVVVILMTTTLQGKSVVKSNPLDARNDLRRSKEADTLWWLHSCRYVLAESRDQSVCPQER